MFNPFGIADVSSMLLASLTCEFYKGCQVKRMDEMDEKHPLHVPRSIEEE